MCAAEETPMHEYKVWAWTVDKTVLWTAQIKKVRRKPDENYLKEQNGV
jgi:hypothetical protein